MIGTFQEIRDAARKVKTSKRIIIPWTGADQVSLLGMATNVGLVTPLFIGSGKDIETLVKKSPLAKATYDIVDVTDPDEALSTAMKMIQDGQADILMQGEIPHQLFSETILNGENNLLTGKLASYVSIYQLLKRDKLIFVSDTYINDKPSLTDKVVILENVLHLARMLDINEPKVAALASIEQVNPAIPSTLDAAILSKMSQRRQFGNVTVEGPLDIDCALDKDAARRKGVESIVTGNVDIYLAPDIDVGYQLAQILVFIGKMQMIGILAGIKVPVIMDLPFVTEENKVTEIALAVVMCGRGG